MRPVHIFLLVLVLAAGSSFATQATQKKKAHPQKKQQPTAQVITDTVVDTIPPQPPPPPPTPEQGPSSPPEVSYQAGQLVIVARNSTMGDVLNAVKQRTGASVEMPPSSTERVVGKFGPGAPRDVMAQLLNGSHYDYVLLGSPADPGALKKVVLLARVSGPQPNTPQPQPAQQMQPGYNGAVRNYQNLQAVPEVENDQQVEDSTPDTSQDVQQPEEEQPPTADQGAADQSQPGQPPMVKTPEQLLRELQQQQQQQQQQDQSGPPAAPQPPPQ